MTDEALLIFGCGVTFLAVAGAYVFVRARYIGVEAFGTEPVPVQAPGRARGNDLR